MTAPMGLPDLSDALLRLRWSWCGGERVVLGMSLVCVVGEVDVEVVVVKSRILCFFMLEGVIQIPAPSLSSSSSSVMESDRRDF